MAEHRPAKRNENFNKTFLRWFVGIAVCLALGDAAQAQSTWRDRALAKRTLTISVFDEAGVERGVVERAEARVEREFRASGIAVRWRNPEWEQAEMGDAPEEEWLHVHILPRARSAAGEVFGMAFLGEDGRGQQADLFYDRIAKFAEQQAQDRAVLLSAVMAHELGHLLLGRDAHTATGIMQARWDKEGVKQISEGLAGFNRAQDARMRERVGEMELREMGWGLAAGLR